jgi:hypothetical protein
VKQSPSSGGMTTENTATTVEIHANAYGTASIFGWGWPDEANLTAFAEQDVRAEQADQTEKTDRVKQIDRMLENNAEYAALYFVS